MTREGLAYQRWRKCVRVRGSVSEVEIVCQGKR